MNNMALKGAEGNNNDEPFPVFIQEQDLKIKKAITDMLNPKSAYVKISHRELEEAWQDFAKRIKKLQQSETWEEFSCELTNIIYVREAGETGDLIRVNYDHMERIK